MSPGDFIKQVGHNTIVNYGLIIPNPNPANGAIQVGSLLTDTDIDIVYQNKSIPITIKDQIQPGSGTGGLVRPGLVFDALGGLGGGGVQAAPSFASPKIKFLLPDLLQSILDEKPDPNVIIKPVTVDSTDVPDLPFTINSNSYAIVNFENKISPNSLQTLEEVNLKLVIYEDSSIEHVGLYTNLKEKNSEKNDSDTFILYNQNKPLEVVDPHRFFSEVTVDVKKINDFKHLVDYNIVFAKGMDKSNIVLNVWDPQRRSVLTTIFDAWEVRENENAEKILRENDQLSENETQSLEDIPELISENELEITKRAFVPQWVKSNASWWSEGKLADSEFVKSLQFLIDEEIIVIPDVKTKNLSIDVDSEEDPLPIIIPSWIKNTTGWWAEELITEDDFVKGLEWLIEEGVIQV